MTNRISSKCISVSNNTSLSNTKTFSCDFNIIDQREMSYVGKVTITNMSNTTISNWEISFYFSDTIETIWNANIISHQGEKYTISNATWNKDINSQESISFGFKASFDSNISTIEGIQIENDLDFCEDDASVYQANSEKIVYDVDDFDTYEEYEAYQNSIGVNPCLRAVSSYFMPEKTTSATAKTEYKITGLKHPKACQSYYISKPFIYVIQRNDTTVFLSRCKIDGTTATYQDEMQLNNFGHGQSLEQYNYNNKNYFLIGCKSDSSSGQDWALQIGRIEYKANAIISYTEIKRFFNLNYSNKSMSNFGKPKRVDAALSTDQSTLLIYKENTSGDLEYSTYNFNKLNKILSDSKSLGVSFKDNSNLRNACYFSFKQPISK